MPLLQRFICSTTNVVVARAGAAGTDEVSPTASTVTAAYRRPRMRHRAPRRAGSGIFGSDMLSPLVCRCPSLRQGAAVRGATPSGRHTPDRYRVGMYETRKKGMKP